MRLQDITEAESMAFTVLPEEAENNTGAPAVTAVPTGRQEGQGYPIIMLVPAAAWDIRAHPDPLEELTAKEIPERHRHPALGELNTGPPEEQGPEKSERPEAGARNQKGGDADEHIKHYSSGIKIRAAVLPMAVVFGCGLYHRVVYGPFLSGAFIPR